MIIIGTSLVVEIVLVSSLAAVYRRLILKVVMYMIVVGVWILLASFASASTSLWEPLVVPTVVVALLNAFIISLLLVPLVIIWLILAT